MRIYTLDEIVSAARERSPFYRDLYRDVPHKAGLHITDLPVIDQDAFWQSNRHPAFGALTGPMTDGIVFRSGGTTGNPKFSVFTRAEWDTFTEIFGRGFGYNGLAPGDRIANLFYAGDLYASFLFVADSLEHAPVPTVHLPMSGAVDIASMAQTLHEFSVNALAGVPTTILNLAHHVETSGVTIPLTKIFFGGEAMYPDQRETLARVFPGVVIRSLGYASVDAGLLGYADLSCAPNEHRALGRETIFEIVDDSDRPITEAGVEGRVVVTNLTRLLMPIVRYPAGDRAMWAEPEAGPPDRRFVLLGRSEEAARIGPMSLYYDDARAALAPFAEALRIAGCQMVIRHRELKDELVLRIGAAADAADCTAAEPAITERLYHERHLFPDLVSGDKIWPLAFEWTAPSALAINARTGKLRRVIDERHVVKA